MERQREREKSEMDREQRAEERQLPSLQQLSLIGGSMQRDPMGKAIPLRPPDESQQ